MTMIHKELSGENFTNIQDVKNIPHHLTFKDIINKRHDTVTHQCIAFDVPIVIEVDNKPFTLVFNFKKDQEFEKVWEVTTLLGDGGKLGDVPLRIKYEIPKADFPLIKIAAMGLLYVRMTQAERMAFYETLNYELLEVTEGI